MKSSQVLYNVLLNLEKSEQVLNKTISYINSEKLVKKLTLLLNDLILIKNKVYNYVYMETSNKKIDKDKVKEKYDECKNIMSFL